MPLALLFIGIILIVVGFQDTYEAFFGQVTKDFTGSGSFLYLIVALGVVGSLGYIEQLQTFSRVLLGLILLSLFIGAVNKGGFFGNLTSGLSSGNTASTDPIGGALPATASASSGGSGGGSSSSDGLGGIEQDLGIVASIASFF